MSKLILLYHSIGSTKFDYNGITVGTENFRRHIEYLRENYLILSAKDLVGYTGSENAVAITFDDGYEDFHTNVIPIINEYNVPVTLFVTTCILNEDNEFWMTRLSELIFGDHEEKQIEIILIGQKYRLSLIDANETFSAYSFLRNVCMKANANERKEIIDSIELQLYKHGEGRKALSISQMREIVDNPLVYIGAHSVSHSSLGFLSEEYAEKEIAESIQELEKISNRKVELFSYPYGTKIDFNNVTENILKKYDIKLAFTTEFRNVSENENYLRIPRCFVDDKDITEFKFFISFLFNDRGHEIQSNYIGSMQRDFSIRGNSKPIWIWGTGENARIVFEYLKTIGQKSHIQGFVKTGLGLCKDVYMGLQVVDNTEVLKEENIVIVLKNNSTSEIVLENSFKENTTIHVWI